MIKLTIQRAPDGLWIVDILLEREGELPLEQCWKTEPCESSEQAYSALVRSGLPTILLNEKLLEYARTA